MSVISGIMAQTHQAMESSPLHRRRGTVQRLGESYRYSNQRIWIDENLKSVA
jgi:hypothetical protein